MTRCLSTGARPIKTGAGSGRPTAAFDATSPTAPRAEERIGHFEENGAGERNGRSRFGTRWTLKCRVQQGGVWVAADMSLEISGDWGRMRSTRRSLNVRITAKENP
jgi:hypothetical protein